jgi:hypothetical protein
MVPPEDQVVPLLDDTIVAAVPVALATAIQCPLLSVVNPCHRDEEGAVPPADHDVPLLVEMAVFVEPREVATQLPPRSVAMSFQKVDAGMAPPELQLVPLFVETAVAVVLCAMAIQ